MLMSKPFTGAPLVVAGMTSQEDITRQDINMNNYLSICGAGFHLRPNQ